MGYISGYEGTYIHYYAPLISSDATATITAIVHDSGQLGLDNPITKTVTFDIKIPSGTEIFWLYDMPLDPSHGNNYIGGYSVFLPIILPDTVNFYNVSFRENIQEQNFPWPDGIHTYTRTQNDTNYFSVHNEYVDALNLVLPNINPPDTIGDYYFDINYLKQGGVFHNCTFDVLIPLEFWAGDVGFWIEFEVEHHKRIYSGSTQSLHIVDEGSFGSDYGDEMGPYQ